MNKSRTVGRDRKNMFKKKEDKDKLLTFHPQLEVTHQHISLYQLST